MAFVSTPQDSSSVPLTSVLIIEDITMDRRLTRGLSMLGVEESSIIAQETEDISAENSTYSCGVRGYLGIVDNKLYSLSCNT